MRFVNKQNAYEFLEHPADVKIKAQGETVAQSFANVAVGMCSTIEDIDSIDATNKQTFTIKAQKITSALYDFLSYIIAYMEQPGYLIVNVTDVQIEHGAQFEISATIHTAKKEFFSALKAPTYNDMVIELEKDNKYYTTVVIDI